MKKKYAADNLTHYVTLSSTLLFIVFFISLITSLIWASFPSLKKFGFSFVTGTAWNIRFLELTNVSIKEDKFSLNFTTTLSSQKHPILSMTYNNTPIFFVTDITNRSIIVTPETPLLEGNYTIKLSSSLKDSYQKSIIDELTWHGTLTNNLLTKQRITGKKLGPIKKSNNDENIRHFNILAFIIGTVASSLLALAMSFPIAISIALFLTEYSRKKSKLAQSFAILIDLLAGIPSVIYGLWGLTILVPIFGANLFTAALVLSVMIIPYTASLAREAISLVPDKLRQAGLGLGASHFQ
ncbi:MAG: PstC family ABC transporter permease, partial [Brevinema sp.]